MKKISLPNQGELAVDVWYNEIKKMYKSEKKTLWTMVFNISNIIQNVNLHLILFKKIFMEK